MTQAPPDVAAAASPLEFRRTVDRELAHRAAVSEVFVTDVRPVTDRRCLVGVQLPPSHAYYGDHVQEPALTDVLLVLEACRQAAICGAHAAPNIPTGTSMLVDSFSIRLTDLRPFVPGAEPVELALENVYLGEAQRSGRVRQGRVEQTLRAAGETVGSHEMDVVFVRGSQHDALRRAQRGSRPPSTLTLAAPDPVDVVPPEQVGRVHPRNVVLSSPVLAEDEITAIVTPHPANRGLFDHAYDHLPAMTLTEAARQLALLSLESGSGAGAGSAHAVGVRSRFRRFAELDAPLLATAPVHPGPITGPTDVTTVFAQDAAAVAETTVSLVPISQTEPGVEPR
jgi:hypothetical protein